jgi:hypothetical protein
MTWKNVSDLSPDYSMARRWLVCAVSSALPERPATRFLTSTKDCRIDGLTDRSRRPYRQASRLPMQIEKLIVGLKKESPHWGAPKMDEATNLTVCKYNRHK